MRTVPTQLDLTIALVIQDSPEMALFALILMSVPWEQLPAIKEETAQILLGDILVDVLLVSVGMV